MFPRLDRFAPAAVEKVAKRKKRVAVWHPGAGPAHHRPDFFLHDRAEAMDGTSGTGRFALLKGALGEALDAVGQKLLAGGAEIRLHAVKIPAVEPDHGLDGPGFPFYPGGFCRHAVLLNGGAWFFGNGLKLSPCE
jgi:hypothetical protein